MQVYFTQCRGCGGDVFSYSINHTLEGAKNFIIKDIKSLIDFELKNPIRGEINTIEVKRLKGWLERITNSPEPFDEIDGKWFSSCAGENCYYEISKEEVGE
jgi:hypothetical protein